MIGVGSGQPGIRRTAGKVRDDDELGPVRWCSTCAEWWPDDGEFWKVIPAGTIASHRGRSYVRQTPVHMCKAHRSLTAAANGGIGVRFTSRRNRYRVPGDHLCRSVVPCMVIVPPGRDQCYGCLGLTAGPLTVERLALLGFVA